MAEEEVTDTGSMRGTCFSEDGWSCLRRSAGGLLEIRTFAHWWPAIKWGPLCYNCKELNLADMK